MLYKFLYTLSFFLLLTYLNITHKSMTFKKTANEEVSFDGLTFGQTLLLSMQVLVSVIH